MKAVNLPSGYEQEKGEQQYGEKEASLIPY